MRQARLRRGRPPEEERHERSVQRSVRAEAQGDLLVEAVQFEIDAYGAAVTGILKSIKLALASGSIGQGAEEDTLRAIRTHLVTLDPPLQDEVLETRRQEEGI